jgi:hypothetical protein
MLSDVLIHAAQVNLHSQCAVTGCCVLRALGRRHTARARARTRAWFRATVLDARRR